VVHQLRIYTDNRHHRNDVILFINGVSAVQIELEIIGIGPRRAVEQIVDYKNEPGNITITQTGYLYPPDRWTPPPSLWAMSAPAADYQQRHGDEHHLPGYHRQHHGRRQCQPHGGQLRAGEPAQQRPGADRRNGTLTIGNSSLANTVILSAATTPGVLGGIKPTQGLLTIASGSTLAITNNALLVEL